MDTLELPPDFKELLSLLNKHGVEYLLIGGYAVGYHGYPRATQDMDLWIAISPDNAKRLVTALPEFIGAADLNPERFLEEGAIMRMGVPPMRVDITNRISGVSFSECYARRVVDTIAGVQVSMISLDDLKNNKRSSGRPKDLADLSYLP
jgi:predicted nucleotidyltransferase